MASALALLCLLGAAIGSPVERIDRVKRASACGPHVLELSEGRLSNLDSFIFDYPPNLDCSWDLFAPPGQKIRLSFGSFDLEVCPGCSCDYVAVYNQHGTEIVKGCGDQLEEAVFMTEVHYVRIVFHTDAYIEREGFELNYFGYQDKGDAAEVCSPDPVLVPVDADGSGSISSFNWPGAYTEPAFCCWMLVAPATHVIHYSFDPPFGLESSEHCMSGDVLQLYDMVDYHSISMMAYCGDDLPPDGETDGHMLKVLFMTNDNGKKGEGFHLNYEAKLKQDGLDDGGDNPPFPEECHHEFVASSESQSLGTPNYPDPYPNNLDCTYIIRAPNGTRLLLNFFPGELEYSDDCSKDSIHLYEVTRHGTTTEMYSLCGQFDVHLLHREIVLGRESALKFVLITDSENAKSGAKLDFKAVPACHHESREYFSSAEWDFYSTPFYPSDYPPNQDCLFQFFTDPDKVFEYQLAPVFALQTVEECDGDYMWIAESLSVHGLAYCGTEAPSGGTTGSNELFIFFHSDAANQHTGFMVYMRVVDKTSATTPATDEPAKTTSSPSPPVPTTPFPTTPVPTTPVLPSTTPECTRRLQATEERQYVTSLNYPLDYPVNVKCMWTISAPEGMFLRYEFVGLFALEYSYRCRYDYIQVLSGAYNSERYCGQQLPPARLVEGSEFRVMFVSDDSDIAAGFKLAFQAEAPPQNCYREYVAALEQQYIVSPMFPDDYPPNLNCTYVVQAPNGTQIVYSIPEAVLETSVDCLKDRLEILEMPSQQLSAAAVPVTECGDFSTEEETVLSSESNLHVKFVTDGENSASGFKIVYRAEPACHSGSEHHFTDSSDWSHVSSPFYPSNYPHDTDCSHLIKTSDDKVLEYYFDELFDIEDSEDCIYDRVGVYDGINTPDVYCGTTTPEGGRTDSSELFVMFHADEGIAGRGFMIYFRAVNPAGADQPDPVTTEEPTPSPTTLPPTTTTPLPTTTFPIDIPEACSGALEFLDVSAEQSVVVQSPGYPRPYPSGSMCQWIVRAPIMMGVTMLVEQVHISEPCEENYLHIYSFDKGNLQDVYRFCGRLASPVTVPVETETVYIQLHTGANTDGATGFSMVVGANDGSAVNATTRDQIVAFKSLHRQTRNEFVFPIRQRRPVDPEPSSEKLKSWQRLENLMNERSKFAKKMGKGDPGTEVQIESEVSGSQSRCYMTEVNLSQGVQTADPDKLEANSCGWVFRADAQKFIKVVIEKLHTKMSGNECVDMVTLSWGTQNILEHKRTMCGQLVSSEQTVYLSDSRYLSIMLSTKYYTKSRETWFSFKISQVSSEGSYEECPGTQFLTASTADAYLQSPGYPMVTVKKDCAWRIQAPTGKVLEIIFLIYDTENVEENLVTIYDGASTNADVVRQTTIVFGVQNPIVLPADVVTTGRYATLACSREVGCPSFLLLYQAITDFGTVSSTTVSLSTSSRAGDNSLRYRLKAGEHVLAMPSSGYTANRKLGWRIYAQSNDMVLKIYVESVNDLQGCSYNSLTLRDGYLGRVMAKMCKTPSQRNYETTGNTLEVLFVADHQVSGSGFQLKIKSLSARIGIEKTGGTPLTGGASCDSESFRCESGSCLVPGTLCDGTNQCAAGDDEAADVCAVDKLCGIPKTWPNTALTLSTRGLTRDERTVGGSPVGRAPRAMEGEALGMNKMKRGRSLDLGGGASRIVGGANAVQGTWPWLVSFYWRDDGHFCGGAVLNKKWILTAAHCFYGLTPFSKRSITVRLGMHSLTGTIPHTSKIETITVHPDYDNWWFTNDIALIKMRTPLPSYTDSVRRVCVPEQGTYPELARANVHVTAVGWGRTHENAEGIPDILQQATFEVLPMETCESAYPGEILPGMFCAGDMDGGIDSCQGDSGGPLVAVHKGRFTVVGVVSWGYGCARKGRPGVYTKVEDYLQWIADNST